MKGHPQLSCMLNHPIMLWDAQLIMPNEATQSGSGCRSGGHEWWWPYHVSTHHWASSCRLCVCCLEAHWHHETRYKAHVIEPTGLWWWWVGPSYALLGYLRAEGKVGGWTLDKLFRAQDLLQTKKTINARACTCRRFGSYYNCKSDAMLVVLVCLIKYAMDGPYYFWNMTRKSSLETPNISYHKKKKKLPTFEGW